MQLFLLYFCLLNNIAKSQTFSNEVETLRYMFIQTKQYLML